MDACVPGSWMNTDSLVRKIRETFHGPMIAVSRSAGYRAELRKAGCNESSSKDDLPWVLLEVLGLS